MDIRQDTLNLDESLIEEAITPPTKAIFPVHYAGVGCEMDRILSIARAHRLRVVEDAAQGVNSRYNGKAPGAIGDLGCYSFHETKNYICGEGALGINDPELLEQAEIIRDKGTNRQKFFRGDVDKYTWAAVGSSYVPSEICSAFPYGQLEMPTPSPERRREIYREYRRRLKPSAAEGLLRSCTSSRTATRTTACSTQSSRPRSSGTASWMRCAAGIHAVFHYVPLHSSPMGRQLGGDRSLPVTEDLSCPPDPAAVLPRHRRRRSSRP